MKGRKHVGGTKLCRKAAISRLLLFLGCPFFGRKIESLGFVNYHEGRSIFSLFRRKLLTCERCPQRVTFERAKAYRRREALPQSGNLSSSAPFTARAIVRWVSFFGAKTEPLALVNYHE
ncbi:MAG: hypothetical protein IJD77_07640 [Clostridia bacterium]|nr:hypothetical protein [Clostridia bacterium]